MRCIFLDISKAFDKVWNEGPTYKLKSNGISGNLYKRIKNYLVDSSQWSDLFLGESSFWCSTRIGSRTAPFLMNINNLPDGIQSICKMFVNDTLFCPKSHDSKNLNRN